MSEMRFRLLIGAIAGAPILFLVAGAALAGVAYLGSLNQHAEAAGYA